MRQDLEELLFTEEKIEKMVNGEMSKDNYEYIYYQNIFQENENLIIYIYQLLRLIFLEKKENKNIIIKILYYWLISYSSLLPISLIIYLIDRNFLIPLIYLSLPVLTFWLVIKTYGIQTKQISKLVSEAEKLNKLIKNIDILDRLQEVGNPVSLEDREKVMSALKITRKNIARALETERILRQNPDFNPAQFEIDFTDLTGLNITDKAGEYGKYLNSAMDIVMNIEKEMTDLKQQRIDNCQNSY